MVVTPTHINKGIDPCFIFTDFVYNISSNTYLNPYPANVENTVSS